MESHVPYTVAFTLPNGDIVADGHNNKFVTVSNIVHEHENRKNSHINLTISNAQKERDQGKYKCTIIDFHNNTASHDEDIIFVDKNYIAFEILKREITSNEGKKTARFLLNYQIYPKPTSFVWYNPKNEIITTDEHVTNRTKYDVKLDTEGEMQFVVKKPSIDDFGEYTLETTIDGEIHTEKVFLTVSG